MKKLYMVLSVVLLMVITGCNKGGEDNTNQANLDKAYQNQANQNVAPAETGNFNNQKNSLPPPIYFTAPPEVVPIPDTDVYTVPDVQEEIFFSGGWWWRPWNGRWYRSHYYDRGWGYYRGAPSFNKHFYAGWRDDFRHHRWRGQQWDYQRVPQRDLDRNWRTWERNGYWHGGGHPGNLGGGHPGGGHPDNLGGGKPVKQGGSKSGGKGSGGPNHQGDERR